MAVSVTANATTILVGGTASVAQAGATGSIGGTTSGTVACSSCCAPQGRYLVHLFGGGWYTGLCPGAIDNSQPFPVYFTVVLSMYSPLTAAQFCIPSSFTLVGTSMDLLNVKFSGTSCSVISPPATTANIDPQNNGIAQFYVTGGGQNHVWANIRLCGRSAGSPGMTLQGNYYSPIIFSVVSCSPPVFLFYGYLVNNSTGFAVGSAAVTVTF